MRSGLTLLSCVALLAAGSGCDTIKGLMGKKDESAAVASAPVPVVPEPTEPEGPEDSEIPTPEDFEEEAHEQITKANYKDELEKLEKELEAE